MQYRCAAILLLAAALAGAAEADALAISLTIRARHLPFGSILDPFIDSQGNIDGYTRCGDSALWTGHYLAAESFRYRVTRDPAALDNVLAALFGVKQLIEVTASNRLARCYVPKSSPFAEGIVREESQSHAVHEGRCLETECWWIGNTSRDQYIGVLFGLGVAYEMVEDNAIRGVVRDFATRLLNRLIDDNWVITAPNGEWGNVFWHRPDQKLALLSIGGKLNPSRFSPRYSTARFFEAGLAGLPVLTESVDPHDSYYKFNLDALTFYHLVRLEGNGYYRDFYDDAYSIFRRTVDTHGNAHFNMIDRAIRGPDADRDAETRALLDAWLVRPRSDERIDLRASVPSCGDDDRACDPLPVPLRVRTDFLWQRSPFLLVGGGAGNIEGAGLDYALPYWMARFHGVY